MSANVDNILNIKISQAFPYLYYFNSCSTSSTVYSDPPGSWNTACFLKSTILELMNFIHSSLIHVTIFSLYFFPLPAIHL